MIELAQNAESRELSDAFEKLGQEAARLQTVIDTVPSFLWTSFSKASLSSRSAFWASSIMFAPSCRLLGRFSNFKFRAKGKLFGPLLS